MTTKDRVTLEFATIDFDEFHRVTLPGRIEAGNGALAAPDLAGVGPLGFKVTDDGASYTYVPGPDTVEIWSSDVAADTLVELSRDSFSDFANELRTSFGLLYSGKAEVTRGSFGWFERWEPALRALYHGRPIIDLTKPAGDDPARTYTLDDTDDDLRRAFDVNGFLHLRGVFTADEIAALSAEVERGRAKARPDDKRSWWATQADGSEVCCRLIYMGEWSPLVAELGDDPRLRRLAALGGDGLEVEADCLDGQSVVIKNPEITAGLSDLPWHRDCGLGGHPVLCPSVAIGIQLDRASAETGQLHFVAGSHRGSSHPLRPEDEAAAPVVAIDAEPGDVTVHFGDTLHAAPPPTGAGPMRRSMYLTYSRPETLAFVGPGNGYNDVLFEHDGQVHSPEELGVSLRARAQVTAESPASRPRYADLPDGCAWDVLDPALGSLVFLTPERVAAAARLVCTGRRFSLDLPVDLPDPPFFGREPVVHTVFDFSEHILDDRLDNYFPQGSTQWDAFSHFAHTERGFFAGNTKDTIQGDGALGIDAWHAEGIVGRGVLLDVARHVDFAPDSAFVATPELLDETAAAQGVELHEGDVLCVRVGWVGWYKTLDRPAREALAEGSRTFADFAVAGVGPGTPMAEWLWDHGVVALALDNPAVEPFPPSAGFPAGTPFTADDMVHVKVLTMLGIPLGEFFDFEALADDCAADRVYEFLFTSAPLGIPGGIGSPPNALAIK